MKLIVFSLVLFLLLPFASAVPFTYVQTSDPDLVNKCFFEPVDFSRYTTPNSRQVVSDDIVEENDTSELLYGQLLDDDGNPWGGVTIRIVWFEGEEKSFTTVTLTREDAALFGDERFEGFYFFNKARVGGAPYRVEVVDVADPIPLTTAPGVQNKTLRAPQAPEPVSDSASLEPQRLLSFLNAYAGVMLLFLLLASLIIVYQFYFKSLPSFHPPLLRRSVKKLSQRLVRTFMQSEFPVIDRDASFRELLAKVVQETYCLVEKDGRFLGLITAEDLVEPLYKERQTTIAALLKHPHTLTPNTPFGQAAILASEYRVFPVVKNGVAVGVVTRHQLLSMYDELFSLNPSGVKHLPKLQHALTQAATISSHDSVEALLETMIAHDTSTVVILDDAPVGLITELHVLEELMDYHDTLHELLVSAFSTRLVTVEASASLLDANRLLLDAQLRALPVTHKGLLIGVVTERSLIIELQAGLKDYV